MTEDERAKSRERYARREQKKRDQGLITASQRNTIKLNQMRIEDPEKYKLYREKQNILRLKRMSASEEYRKHQSDLRKKANDKRRLKPEYQDLASQYRNTGYVRLKMGVIDAYGGKCEICGEDRPEMLTIDHSWNDGNVHRAKSGGIYRDLRSKEYPKDLGLRILCWNCNCSMGSYGYIPKNKEDSPIYQRWLKDGRSKED